MHYLCAIVKDNGKYDGIHLAGKHIYLSYFSALCIFLNSLGCL